MARGGSASIKLHSATNGYWQSHRIEAQVIVDTWDVFSAMDMRDWAAIFSNWIKKNVEKPIN